MPSAISNQMGLLQLVTEPSRGKYVPDLKLADVPDCTATPCAAVADHKGVLTRVNFKIPETAIHQREVLHFRDADWARIASNIEETNWEFLSEMAPSEGTYNMTETLLRIAKKTSLDAQQISGSRRIRG